MIDKAIPERKTFWFFLALDITQPLKSFTPLKAYLCNFYPANVLPSQLRPLTLSSYPSRQSQKNEAGKLTQSCSQLFDELFWHSSTSVKWRGTENICKRINDGNHIKIEKDYVKQDSARGIENCPSFYLGNHKYWTSTTQNRPHSLQKISEKCRTIISDTLMKHCQSKFTPLRLKQHKNDSYACQAVSQLKFVP